MCPIPTELPELLEVVSTVVTDVRLSPLLKNAEKRLADTNRNSATEATKATINEVLLFILIRPSLTDSFVAFIIHPSCVEQMEDAFGNPRNDKKSPADLKSEGEFFMIRF
jgi:hypothetical protein